MARRSDRRGFKSAAKAAKKAKAVQKSNAKEKKITNFKKTMMIKIWKESQQGFLVQSS